MLPEAIEFRAVRVVEVMPQAMSYTHDPITFVHTFIWIGRNSVPMRLSIREKPGNLEGGHGGPARQYCQALPGEGWSFTTGADLTAALF